MSTDAPDPKQRAYLFGTAVMAMAKRGPEYLTTQQLETFERLAVPVLLRHGITVAEVLRYSSEQYREAHAWADEYGGQVETYVDEAPAYPVVTHDGEIVARFPVPTNPEVDVVVEEVGAAYLAEWKEAAA